MFRRLGTVAAVTPLNCGMGSAPEAAAAAATENCGATPGVGAKLMVTAPGLVEVELVVVVAKTANERVSIDAFVLSTSQTACPEPPLKRTSETATVPPVLPGAFSVEVTPGRPLVEPNWL